MSRTLVTTAAPLAFSLERVATPLGTMLVLTDDAERLRAVDWEDYEPRMHALLRRQYGKGAVQVQETPQTSYATRQLLAYFDGQVDAIDGLAVALGGTDFQRQVWQALRGIAAGDTVSYGILATRIGRASAVRAVGMANGANPVGIVVPCHRVIGADASLTGYGGGLDRKRWLLEHEGRWRAARPAESLARAA
ncbi:Methylated-DNA--protein-cysteine methyltransferase [Achromobacter deleyi]|uniref:methylated-DNA--[protein]-cysteine S-methyltransferase n=2 Tax=Achromobacter deleyi TaxID=1353891 RepID=A0A6S7AG99_9BURK|nr:methylated-DNA--[protein]-cysteine S-methyltransferase [Achromobacter deleyi]CAB3668921.1 Methylated-DNA--protein-cysteine methyltransferase [Achromobacter deleyi]CAB3830797.1 Methylated-DNA--protein-cysteine methyltransferase [Achromobacter deleyi]CAB3858236.1 Methylated-DNA--protein-cysteine methyltransferase [Achromobacter deleyi]CAB3927827.1 Methylated-DNA--protein-cysteine methyltransferase [Achromobacter deleyi]